MCFLMDEKNDLKRLIKCGSQKETMRSDGANASAILTRHTSKRSLSLLLLICLSSFIESS
ncbi:hypothetical protein Syun_030638 [Stephania yunnanensis]|uniref:Uncharacterized protein n=1 Tax=Stephania yunnanensis TaxID=152371 RepID=A0AAP0DXK0_9MAGN